MYAIRKIQFFFGPTVRKSYVTDGFRGDERAEFKTRAEAEAVCEQLNNEVYYTAHNESGHAEYRVVRVK